jgi:DNA-nicking Smr family endonuclease
MLEQNLFVFNIYPNSRNFPTAFSLTGDPGMSSSDNNFSNRPFENLGRLLKRKSHSPLPAKKLIKPSQTVSRGTSEEAISDRQLFLNAVLDVTPIQKQHPPLSPHAFKTAKGDKTDLEEPEPNGQLKRLVSSGEGFVISQTPEYMAGAGHDVPEFVIQQLHQGRFSIQDHIDLHGMDAPSATDALEDFLQRSTMEGLRSVLIIHGRGLRSPGEPVLKSRLKALLSSNRWRKWILAFSSARCCDGGAGATYVLLRKKPLTKKMIRRHSRKH